MESQFLPIGSVVRLKDSTADVMIAGYLPIGSSNSKYVWDYSGFKYPMGYVDNDEIYCFNQDQIEEIQALGYQDKEQFAFFENLDMMAEEIRLQASMDGTDYPEDEEKEE